MIKQAIISVFLTTVAITAAYSQTAMSEAFSASYTHEHNQEYAQAIQVLSNHYSKSSYEVNLRLGWLYYLNGDYIKSQTYYSNAIALKPKSIEALLGYIYPAAALQNWNDVSAKYKAIVSIDPNHSTANYRLAEIHFYKKEFSTAEKYVKRVQATYPFDYSANLLAGKIQISLGKITEAKKSLNAALLYDPTSEDAKVLFDKL